MTLPVALAVWPPQKNVGAAARPMGSSQTRGCRNFGANPLVARVAGDPLIVQTGDGTRRPIQTSWFEFQSPILADRCRRNSCEAARHGSNALRSFRMWEGHARASLCASALKIATTLFRLRLLAFVEPFRLGAVAQRKVGRLDEGPGQVLVAVPGVAFPLLLAVAGAHTVDATCVGGEVAGGSESLDRPGFQQDRGGQHLADARHAGEAGGRTPCSPPTFSCRRFSSRSICAESVAMTATLALIASATSAGSGI